MNPETVTSLEVAMVLEIDQRSVQRLAKKEEWQFELNGDGRGTHHYLYADLPEYVKEAFQRCAPGETSLVATDYGMEEIKMLSDPGSQNVQTWTPERAISMEVIRDRRVQRIFKVIQEAENIPPGWKRRKWIENVALRHEMSPSNVYREIAKYDKRGLAGVKHRKANGGKPKAWSPEALEFWIGLCLKREHRKIDKKALYANCLTVEAQQRGWNIGSYESARWWYERKVTPQLLALQRGGSRALDNVLPPIRRDYSDLTPFEILVGDQHKFDFWVVDDETGEVFRPEGYFWQDLRTRIIYGGAVDKRYDSWLIGMALRIGIRSFGAFKSVYTDNGKPELSRYLMKILGDMRALNLSWEQEIDLPMDVLGADPEEINPDIILPGSHRKAIVKNAKAKMIEGTFKNVENILCSVFRVPGNVKDLTGDIHEQDIDQAEIKRLAEQGRLLLFSEFILYLYRALDYYNREKAHRGVLREWFLAPKPKSATPLDCLKACCIDGWKPRMISEEAADLLFLAKEDRGRVVNLGRIQFRGQLYEHEALISLTGKVNVRYNPLDPEWILVSDAGRYICTAHLMEYSSMKDRDLAERKIHEKRARQKKFLKEYRKLTAAIPDLRQYSEVPHLEKVAALVGAEKKKRAAEQAEISRTWTAEELEAEVERTEKLARAASSIKKPLPARPSYFLQDSERYEWCFNFELRGGKLSEEDRRWKEDHEALMSEGQREHWQAVREYEQRA